MKNPLLDEPGEGQPAEFSPEDAKAFQDKHQELSILSGYPPFSINRAKYKELADAIVTEGQRIQSEGGSARPFSTLEVKFQDDLDEARLYQKRYNNIVEAQDAAVKLEGLAEDDENILKFY
jgi:hypothetical protein